MPGLGRLGLDATDAPRLVETSCDGLREPKQPGRVEMRRVRVKVWTCLEGRYLRIRVNEPYSLCQAI